MLRYRTRRLRCSRLRLTIRRPRPKPPGALDDLAFFHETEIAEQTSLEDSATEAVDAEWELDHHDSWEERVMAQLEAEEAEIDAAIEAEMAAQYPHIPMPEKSPTPRPCGRKSVGLRLATSGEDDDDPGFGQLQ